MQRPPPFSRNNSSGSVKCHQRSDHTDRWSLHGASQGSKPWSFLLSLRCFRGIVPLDVRAEHGAAGIAAGSPSLDLYPAPLRQRCAPLLANRSVCVCCCREQEGSCPDGVLLLNPHRRSACVNGLGRRAELKVTLECADVLFHGVQPEDVSKSPWEVPGGAALQQIKADLIRREEMLLGKAYLEWWSVRRVHPTYSATQSSLWALTHGKMNDVHQLSRSGRTELSAVLHESASDRDSRMHKLHCPLLSCHSQPHPPAMTKVWGWEPTGLSVREHPEGFSHGSPELQAWNFGSSALESGGSGSQRDVRREPLREADIEHWNSKVQHRIFRIHTLFSTAACSGTHVMMPLTSCYPFTTCPG